MCKYLLKNNFIYVMLGEYSTSYVEKAFSKFRQNSGGTYFITVQNVAEKLNIQKAKLLLDLKVNVLASLPLCTKMALFYIAGYVTRKDDVSKKELLTDTAFYFRLFGDYTITEED